MSPSLCCWINSFISSVAASNLTWSRFERNDFLTLFQTSFAALQILFKISRLNGRSNFFSKSAMTLFNDLGDSLICCRAIAFCSSVKVHGRPLPGRSTNPLMPCVSHL